MQGSLKLVKPHLQWSTRVVSVAGGFGALRHIGCHDLKIEYGRRRYQADIWKQWTTGPLGKPLGLASIVTENSSG